MKIFVTGSTGFVGSHLCRRLLELNHEVYGLVRNKKKLDNEQLNIKPIIGSLSYKNENTWLNQLPKDLDIIIHVAGIVHSFNKQDFININTKATEQLISDFKNNSPKSKLIFISSLAAAGPGVKSETDPLTPVSAYGESKKQAELLLPKNMNITIIRPPMVIGPSDPAILDIFKMVKSKIILTAGKEAKYNKYSFVCVFDLVEAIINSLDKETNVTEDFFIAHENIVSFEQIIKTISNVMDKKVIYLAVPIRLLKFVANILCKLPFDFRLTPDKINELIEPSWVCKNGKSLSKLKMKYKWNLKETIEVTYQDYKKRNWI